MWKTGIGQTRIRQNAYILFLRLGLNFAVGLLKWFIYENRLKRQTRLRAAVWMQVKVRERGLELRLG